jgi:DNA end-binding protein Ku
MIDREHALPISKQTKALLAEHIIESKATHLDASLVHDRFETALREMLKLKQEGKPPSGLVVQPTPPSNVINLIDALRRSIDARQKQQTSGKPPRKLNIPSRTPKK